jgi:hypothetical protein
MTTAQQKRASAMTRHQQAETPSGIPDDLRAWLVAMSTAGCVRIEARHVVSGQQGSTMVGTWEAFESEEEFDAQAIIDRLDKDAGALGGEQDYYLLAFRAGAGKTPRDRFPIRRDGGAAGRDGLVQAVDAAALLAQTHSHQQKILDSFLGSSNGDREAMRASLSEANKTIAALREENTELWGIIKEARTSLLTDKQTEHDNAIALMREKLMHDAGRNLLPVLAEKVAGALGAKGAGAIARLESASRFFESLSDEQKQTIFGCLTQDQALQLMTLLDMGEENRKENTTGPHDGGSPPNETESINGVKQ